MVLELGKVEAATRRCGRKDVDVSYVGMVQGGTP